MFDASLSILKKKLDANSLTYYIQSVPNCGTSVAVALIIKAGSIIEKENELGLSHFLEHMSIDMMLYPHPQNGLAFDTALHAHTNFNETVYLFTNKEDDTANESIFVSNCLSTASKILSGDLLKPSSMERVRRDVSNELAAFEMSKMNAIRQLFNNHLPELNLPIGKMPCINNFQYMEVIKHHNKWYLPRNAAIIVNSSLETQRIESMIANEFAVWQQIQLKSDCPAKEEVINPFCHDYVSNDRNDKHCICYISKVRRSRVPLESYIESLLYLELALIALKMTAEICLTSAKIQYSDIDASAEIFANDWHLIRFRIDLVTRTDSTEYSECFIKKLVLDELVLKKALDIYKQKIKVCVQSNIEAYSRSRFIDECIQNFLFDEPILDFDDELIYIKSYINKVTLGKIDGYFNEIRNNSILIQ